MLSECSHEVTVALCLPQHALAASKRSSQQILHVSSLIAVHLGLQDWLLKLLTQLCTFNKEYNTAQHGTAHYNTA